MDELPVVWENRVRFEETDMQGVVFYGNYVTFQDEASSAYFRAIDYSYGAIAEAGWDIHVVNVDLDYRGQATFEDELVHGFRVATIGESSMTSEYAAWRPADDELLAEGTVTHVAVDGETGDPTRVPDEFREAVIDFQERPPEQA
ncbi:acyl-CoA thioesterase [Halorientalis brevis]|uniref:Acyl-CoA thioesterase n=1 Tax=Halorientalis brevis TaxID=1126241 RepID=A0ABD6CBI5_9EURY|nr:thioesterase family protein [Halorientalis brevis]